MCSAATLQTSRMQVNLQFRCLRYHRDNSLTIMHCFLKTVWHTAELKDTLNYRTCCFRTQLCTFMQSWNFVFVFCFFSNENLIIAFSLFHSLILLFQSKIIDILPHVSKFVCWPLGYKETCIWAYLRTLWASVYNISEFINDWHPEALGLLQRAVRAGSTGCAAGFNCTRHRCVNSISSLKLIVICHTGLCLHKLTWN